VRLPLASDKMSLGFLRSLSPSSHNLCFHVQVVASVSKLVRVMTSLPRLERFVKDVCTFVSAKAMGDYRADGTPLAPQDYVNR
jgi:hypothetical protein